MLFTERANRDTLQAAIGRTSPQLVTAAELDFHFPPEQSVLESCTHILSSLQGWRALSRCSANCTACSAVLKPPPECSSGLVKHTVGRHQLIVMCCASPAAKLVTSAQRQLCKSRL